MTPPRDSVRLITCYTQPEPLGGYRGCFARLPIHRRRAFVLVRTEEPMGVETLRRSTRDLLAELRSMLRDLEA